MSGKNESQENFRRRIIKEMIIYSQISIFSPLILFGGLGFLLYKYFQKPYIFLLFVIFSFFVMVFLLVKRVKFFSKKIESLNKSTAD